MKLEKKTEKDLVSMLGEKRKALRGFRFGLSGSKIKNVKDGRNLKKEIARVLTELKIRENKEEDGQ